MMVMAALLESTAGNHAVTNLEPTLSVAGQVRKQAVFSFLFFLGG
jgi:hypothetical protein